MRKTTDLQQAGLYFNPNFNALEPQMILLSHWCHAVRCNCRHGSCHPIHLILTKIKEKSQKRERVEKKAVEDREIKIDKDSERGKKSI